jgi:hypothetical protein
MADIGLACQGDPVSLHRHDPADRAPPWGKKAVIEDVFDLPDRGTILQVKAWVPGSACRVRVQVGKQGELETTAYISRPIGDHVQAALLIKGRAASDFRIGDEIEFISADVG